MRVDLPQDLADVKAGGFELLPPGTYFFEVDNIEMKTGKDSQKPYMNMTYKVLEDEELAGRKIFDMITLSADALWRLKQFSLATGIDIGTNFDTEDFLGATFSAVVDVEKGGQKPGTDDMYPDKNKIKSFVYTE